MPNPLSFISLMSALVQLFHLERPNKIPNFRKTTNNTDSISRIAVNLAQLTNPQTPSRGLGFFPTTLAEQSLPQLTQEEFDRICSGFQLSCADG